MKKKFVLTALLVLCLFAASAIAKEMTGWISDSKCGAKGAKAEHADCAKKCVDEGASPVFVSDDKVYKIDDPDKVKEHIGHKVTVDGDVDGDTIQISSLKMAE
jgi:hypothetical protein